MTGGLKSVRNRRDDALSRIGWDQLETLLADHYRGEGYQVEHVGTGGTGRKFDGGIDLKLRKDDAYVLVQSKHWNVYQVTHNAVHELLGLMVNEGATGAILVTSGEFTRAAIEAATRQGHVQLIDGDDLRVMLGPLPDTEGAGSRVSDFIRGISASPHTRRLGRAVQDRLLSELEDVIRGGRPIRYARKAVVASFWLFVLKIVGVLLVFVFLISMINGALKDLATPRAPSKQTTSDPTFPPRYDPRASRATLAPVKTPSHRQPTPEEIREAQRKADEAIKVIEASTPEM